MNNIELGIRAVEREPLREIYASMLVDALVEERDMLITEAQKHVVSIQLSTINALQVATVAALFACPGEPRERVLALMELHWPPEAHRNAKILVISGESKPLHVIGDGTGNPNPFVDVVSVGAGFLLSFVSAGVIEQARQFNGQTTPPKKRKAKR